MTLTKRALLTVAILGLAPMAALAEPPPAAAAVKAGDQQFDFDTDEVTVDVLKPDATMVEVLGSRARASLIRIRMDFVKEIVRSAEDL